MKKRGLKITLGILIGCLAVGATWGALYGLNSSVRNWFDNAVNKVTKDVPEVSPDGGAGSSSLLCAAVP